MILFLKCLLVLVVGVPVLGVMLYFLMVLFLYADRMEEEEFRRRHEERQQNIQKHDRGEN